MKRGTAVGLAIGVALVVGTQGFAQEGGAPGPETVGREGLRMRAGQRGGAGGMFEGREGRMGGPGAMGMNFGGGGEAMLARILTNPKVVEELGLSTGQVATLRQKLDSIRKEIATLTIDLENASVDQARLLTTQAVDEAAIMATVEKAGEIRTKIAKLWVQQILLVKNTLTPEQIEKARSMRERAEKEREKFMNNRGEGGGPGQWRRPRERGAAGPREGRPPEHPDGGPGGQPPPPPPEQAL